MNTLPPSVPQPRNSALAIWSLVLGILGLVSLMCIFGPLFAIPAVICGHMALKRVKASGGTLGGHGIALAGLITGYVGIGLFILMIPLLAAIAIPNFVKARSVAQKNSCINNLRAIDLAKNQWALENNKTNLDEVPTIQEIQPYLPKPFESLRCPAGGVYTINTLRGPPTCSVPDHKLPGTDPAQ